MAHLEAQLSNLNVACEIICCDDGSKTIQNKFLVQKSNVQFLQNDRNIGRTETRQKLANAAKYNWLLFLDADVVPVKVTFLQSYVELLQNETLDLCFGGFAYEDQKPEKEFLLRWKYGREKESISAAVRNLKPYKTVISANILVKKSVFMEVNSSFVGNYYGYDNLFSMELQRRKKRVIHIDNPVYHLGLESNKVYLKKKEQAAETIFKFYKEGLVGDNDNLLLKTYLLLNRWKLSTLVSTLFEKSKKRIQENLLGRNPSIFLLNCYRLGYFCTLIQTENKTLKK